MLCSKKVYLGALCLMFLGCTSYNASVKEDRDRKSLYMKAEEEKERQRIYEKCSSNPQKINKSLECINATPSKDRF